MSEKGRRWSPYVYASDAPLRFIGPDGMWPEFFDNLVIGWSGIAKKFFNRGTYEQIGMGSQQYAANATIMVKNVKLDIASGDVIVATVGKIGAEANLGTKKIVRLSVDGATPGDPNKTTEGVSVSYGAGKLEYEKETTGAGSKAQTQEKTSLTFAGFGPKAEQTNGGPVQVGFEGHGAEVKDVITTGFNSYFKDVKISVSLYFKFDLKYEGPPIRER